MTLTESSRKGTALAQFRQVYLWQLKRNRLMSVLCLGLTLLCCTVVHLVQSARSWDDYFNTPLDNGEHPSEESLRALFSSSVGNDLLQTVATILVPLLLVFLVVCTVQTFQYMHKRRSVDLFHALPIRRTPLLLGSLAAIGTMLGGAAILNLLICGGVDMAMGACGGYNWGWILGQLGYLLLLLAASLCGTVFLLVSCGTVSSAVMAGILLTIGWPVLVVCGASIIEGSLPGCTLDIAPAVFTALTPYLALLIPYFGNEQGSFYTLFSVEYKEGTGFVDTGITVWLVLWWVLVTVVLLAGCVLVYRKRKSEAAENQFAYPLLRFAIRFLVSAAVGLAFASFFGSLSNSNLVFYGTAFLAAAVAHIVIQVVWVRGLRQLARSMVAYGGLVVVMALFFVGVATGGLGYATRIPDLDKVNYIRVDIPLGIHYDDSKETYLAYRSRSLSIVPQSDEPDYDEGVFYIEDEEDFYLYVEPKLQTKESIQTIQGLQQAFVDYYQGPYLPIQTTGDYRCVITYYLKNGKTMTRSYLVPGDIRELDDLTAYSSEPYGTPKLRAEMAKVVALKEFQAFTLIDWYTPDRMESVQMNLQGEDGNDILFGESEELTAQQKKLVWNTFLQELNSEKFAWTYAENQDNIRETCYYIIVESEWSGKDWPEHLTELIETCSEEGKFDPEKQPQLVLEDSTYFYVPKSCTKTRAVIKELIGDHIQRSDQDAIE